ncbi:MAG: D-mannonate oxidoreductase [Lentisphaerae bacterium RIFOXYA12_FULL_48_11]|nr:MAG: D-mannonate oxidoreductase [Lentisphaerae bacterium RIFOXYA12_FULL_48_11]
MENDLLNLKNKVCVITGGAGVIGRHLSVALGRVGVRTVILNRTKETGEKVAAYVTETTGAESMSVSADVLDRESLQRAFGAIRDRFGEVDILINNAGGNHPAGTADKEQISQGDAAIDELEKSIFGLGLEGFRNVFDLNTYGTLLPTLIFGRSMVERSAGSIINMSSMAAIRPLTRVAAYSAAKAAITNLTQWLAVHLARTGVRVNAVAPGFFLTEQNRFLLTDEKSGALKPRGERIIKSTPMGRFGKPEEISGTVIFLASDLSMFVTGTVIPVDGGFSAFGGV